MNTIDRVRRHLQDFPGSKPIVGKTLYELGESAEVDSALANLVEEGVLRWAADGVFGKPIETEFGVTLGFGSWEIAQALCRAEGHVISVTPAEWANNVSLSTQIVAVPSYITDGPSREVPWGKRGAIHFVHANDRDIRLGQSTGGGALLGLEWARPPYPLIAFQSLSDLLPPEDFAHFLQGALAAGGWVGHAAKVFEASRAGSGSAPGFDLDDATMGGLIEKAFTSAFRENEARSDERMRDLGREIAIRRGERNGS